MINFETGCETMNYIKSVLYNKNEYDKKILDIINFIITKLMSELDSNSGLTFKDKYINLFNYSAICLLLTEIKDVLDEDIDWDGLVLNNMKKVKNILDEMGYYIMPCNFEGNSDVAFSIYALAKKTTYYDVFLEGLNNLILEQTKIKLKSLKHNNKDILLGDYDLISGLSGICLYLIQFKSHKHVKKTILEIIEWLILLMNEVNVDGYNVPMFYIKSENQHYPNKDLFPNGSLNFSLSHGIAGVLATLSICLKEEIEVQGQRQCMKKILDLLKNTIYIENKKYCWPGILDLKDYVNHNYRRFSNGASWCYGTPGIARAVFLAANELGDNEGKDLAIQVMINICNMNYKQLNLNSPILCHGYAGLLACIYTMYLDTKNKIFKDAIFKYSNTIVSYFNTNNKYGFQDIIIDKYSNNIIKEDKVNFLEGNVGIALALLVTYKWDKPIWLRHMGLI